MFSFKFCKQQTLLLVSVHSTYQPLPEKDGSGYRKVDLATSGLELEGSGGIV